MICHICETTIPLFQSNLRNLGGFVGPEWRTASRCKLSQEEQGWRVRRRRLRCTPTRSDGNRRSPVLPKTPNTRPSTTSRCLFRSKNASNPRRMQQLIRKTADTWLSIREYHCNVWSHWSQTILTVTRIIKTVLSLAISTLDITGGRRF